jgi:cytochrome c oxidase subunit 2
MAAGALGMLVGPAARAQGAVPPEALLHPAGPQASIVAKVLTWDIGAVIILALTVGAVTAYAIWRAWRRRRSPGLPPQTAGNARLEIGWTLALTVGAVILLVHPIEAEFAFDQVPPNALTVNVTGHQWWWEFQYPDQGVVTANELHIPTGRVIRVQLTSADVIHAFSVPRLGGHDLAIPGRVTTIWLQAPQAGVYQGQCEEFCGASHARMLFKVIAQPPDQFAAWIAALQHPVIQPQGADAAAGEKYFLTGPCSACHTINGTTAQGTVGPNLTLFGERTSIGGGVLDNTAANLAMWLRDPGAIKPSTDMPNLHLTDTQIQDLVAFLEGLKR